MKLDYTITVPAEIREMAMKIEDYFLKQGVHKWELMGICSRDFVTENKFLEERLKNIKELVNKA